ncbi:uncharacterized protein LOC128550388 [Mercenaria mercenaria]|uniref:uncharacterized protein LOC128550388 n=1 Tax=Mercenaria mercenaria TaxID=6596 RepID=UPI00234E5C3E|nr:uncharacterized protein LOC128550388 [Mercenaria mercenaria]
MFHMSNYVNNVSLTLSEVLKDIGVDEKTVLRRRRGLLLGESTARTVFQLQQRNADMYFFGSQSEGTTTPGLFSDSDRLFSLNNSNVIQDWREWEPAKNNYMMIQDETVAPGYCRLQLLRHDVPLPYNCVPNEHYFRDRERVLFKNTCIHAIARQGQVRHGPAHSQEGQPGWVDLDRVAGFPCISWPKQARHWLDRQGIGHWPSDNMKRYCESSGCFVVGVGSKDSDYEELEWRISTSLAERCLMYNMNITQIRCYVLMKMILKTYFKPHFGDAISSFICKTVLFHCIANTNSNQWRENNLLICLTFCLFRLYNCVLNDNCPHFIVH